MDTSHDDSDLQPLEKKKQSTKAHNRNQIADDKKIVNQSNNSNYKRSIEIRNGIPMRSMNNLHKVSNAIGLHFYVVSIAPCPPARRLLSLPTGRHM